MTTPNKENKTPLRISITQPEKFEKLAATTMETTQKLAKRINKLFSSAFVDYYGSVIYVVPGNGNTAINQQFRVELHFKPIAAGSVNSNDSRVRAFQPIEEVNAGADIVNNLKAIYKTMSTSAKFQLTEDAAQILSEFMLHGTNVDPWKPSSYDQFKSEYIDNQQYGHNPIMTMVYGLDLLKLIKAIYGGKTEDGSKVDYGVIPYGPVNPALNNQVQMAPAANWKIMIMQIDANKTFDLASEMGIIPAGNGGAIVTGY